MDHAFNIPDSTDWLDTPLAGLARVESALRCQVCKDLFNNPVITSCCHTFCSLCIRRCLSSEGKCPVCRAADQELKLRRNWAVQELVDSFTLTRSSVLDFAKTAVAAAAASEESDTDQPAAKKRKVGSYARGRDDVRRTRSQSRRSENQAETNQPDVISKGEEGNREPDDGLVACPICSRRMKNEQVFPHLDICTGPQAKQSATPRGQRSTPPASRNPQTYPSNSLDRLPTINYSLLKETILRKKLRDLGIPDWGGKPLLQKRHTEWMNLWNANCDSTIPKSKRDLLRELDTWEKTQGGQAPALSAPTATSSVMRKDFDSRAWSANHGDDYKRLIADAQKHARKTYEPIASFPDPQPQLGDHEIGEDYGIDNGQGKGKSHSETPLSERDIRDETSDMNNDGLGGRSRAGNSGLKTERQQIVVEDAIA